MPGPIPPGSYSDCISVQLPPKRPAILDKLAQLKMKSHGCPACLSALPASDADFISVRPLSPWNQTSLRIYTQNVLCFPFEDGKQTAAVAHLRAALDRLAKQRPDFAGRLQICSNSCPGRVCLHQSASHVIPLDVFAIGDGFEYTYAQLSQACFPPAAFVHPRFSLDGSLGGASRSVPVYRLRAYFIRGGLLLTVAFHHAFSDGDCTRMFLECLAAQTRSAEVHHPSGLRLRLSPPGGSNSVGSVNLSPGFEELLEACPEFAKLPDLSGPTTSAMLPGGTPLDQIPKTGKVFVFKNSRLKELVKAIKEGGEEPWPSPPSSYTCLAALTWAHIATARLDTETYLKSPASSNGHKPSSNGSSVRHDEETTIHSGGVACNSHPAVARLYNPVNWKARLGDPCVESYFGNATAVPMTHFPTNTLLHASQPPKCTASAATGRSSCGSTEPAAALARLARAIDTTIRGVDAAFVRTRLALFESAPDPRILGLHFDPRSPQDLGFNTWRHFAADAKWSIPGVVPDGRAEQGDGGGEALLGDGAGQEDNEGRKPDAICRAQAAWNMGGALILPARADSTCHELLVTLPVVSMEKLCADQEWMKWVETVIG